MGKLRNRVVGISLTAALLVASFAGTLPQKYELIPSTTASAASEWTGYTSTGFIWQSSSYDYLLYLTATSDTTVAVSGCGTWSTDRDITIPETATYGGKTYTVISIADNAFKNQTNIKSVSGGLNVTTIGASAFEGCSNLKFYSQTTYGRGGNVHLYRVNHHAFYNCSNLHDASIYDATIIDDYAFANCTLLGKNDSPYAIGYRLSKLNTIGNYAFFRCSSLTELDMGDSYVPGIGKFAFAFSGLKHITLPGCTTIGESAFFSCSSLKYVNIPVSVRLIEGGAFQCCSSLEKVIIPSSVSVIKSYAFNCCNALKYAAINGTECQIGEKAFGYIYSNKMSGFVLYGCGNGAKNYAASNGITYKKISESIRNEAVQTAAYTPYMWNFLNTKDSLAYGVLSGNKHIFYPFYTDEDKAAAQANKVFLDASPFGGSCCGMSSLSIMAATGCLDVSRFGNFTTPRSVRSLYITKSLKSCINYCQESYLSAKGTQYALSSSLHDNKLSYEMIENCRQINYGGAPVRINYTPSGQCLGHAVVGYGYETAAVAGKSAWTFACCPNTKFDARILIYDPNYYQTSESRHLYINTSTGEYCMPDCTYEKPIYSCYGQKDTSAGMEFAYQYDELASLPF